MRSLSLASLALPLLGACADGGSAPTGVDGPAVQIAVAPLTLPGVTDVCYGITVYNGAPDGDPAPDTVWSKQGVCSVDYGNAGGGDVTYVGTCDANGTNNFVELVLETVTTTGGLLDDQVTANAEGGDGDADFENPCTAAAPCTLDFPCNENEDTLVEFNLTVMRDANQGFFDVAVNFEDIFCSAKLDSCYNVTMTEVPLSQQVADNVTLYYYEFGTTTYAAVWLDGELDDGVWYILDAENNIVHQFASVEGKIPPTTVTFGGTTYDLVMTEVATGTPMGLLFGPDTQRDHTAVAALACTAGPGSAGTELLMTAPMVSCNSGAVAFQLDLDGAPAGNGSVLDATNTYTLRYALYFGQEQLQCNGGSCQKIYYNIALNIAHLAEQGLGDCRVFYAASAHTIGDGVVDQYGTLSDPNGVYPAIIYGLASNGMGTQLTSAAQSPTPLCTANPLNGTGSEVATTYVEGSAFGGGGGTFNFFSQGDEATAFQQPQ